MDNGETWSLLGKDSSKFDRQRACAALLYISDLFHIHSRALFIKAELKGKMTCCVMVDNGSAINVCPLKILPKLELAVSDLKPSEVVIKAYDDT